jgi:hypothetical protein
MDVTGNRATANITQAQRKPDILPAVLELEPSAAPLVVLTGNMESTPTHQTNFSWFEDKLQTRFDTTTTTGTGTTVAVGTGSNFAANDLVKVTRTGEVMKVSSVASNNLTVARGIGGSAIALVNGDELLIIGRAKPENDTSDPARSNNPVQKTNYTQIIRTPIESSNTLRATDTWTIPSDWDRQTQHAGIEHKKDWEYTFFFGLPSEDTTNTAKPLRTTGGVFNFVATNVTDAGGTMTEDEFFGAMNAGFRYGSQDMKTAFASRLAVGVVNAYPRGKLELIQSDRDQTYGLKVTRYVSPFGDLNLITHNLLEGATYGGYIVGLDMRQIKRRPLANADVSRDTQILTNRQPNDQDGRKDEYLTEQGLQFGQEKAHFYIKNITG